MNEEIFLAPEKAPSMTPSKLAAFLVGHGLGVRACAVEGGWRLEFDDASGTYADLATDSSGNVRTAFFFIGRLRDDDDFRRIKAGFQQLGWEYCDSSYYDTP